MLFGVTAGQATWGGPDWWPVTVGAAALTCVCGIGFAAGVFAPGRFTAPLAAIGMFMLSLVAARGTGFRTGNPIATLHRQPLTPALSGSGDALLSPSGGTPSIRIGVYYPYLPDLAIAQLLLLAGLTVAVLGVLGLRRGPGARAAPRAMVALVLTTPPGVAYSVSGSQGTPAQQAVALALLQDSGVQVQPGCSYGEAFCAPAPGTAQYLVFRRFAALPAATRHAWLAANLTALRAGRVTLEQIPVTAIWYTAIG